MDSLPGLITGGTHKDERGTLTFFNELDLMEVKRLYKIEHLNTETVRAWQAHQKEQKWFYVVKGAFKIVIVQPDNWENPSADLPVNEFILRSEDNQVLHIFGGNATGFQALEPGSQMIVFSDFTVQQSADDDFRFPNTLWYKWKNQIK